MKTSQEIKALFNELPIGVQNNLLGELLIEQELQGKVLHEAQETVIQKRKNKPCPHCSSTKVYKRGKQRGVQMYRCNDCNKWYSETTGTPLYDIKLKHKWQSYLNCMEQGMPIKKIAKELGISIQTSFDWRHKVLSSLSEFTPSELSNEVECDELELALSLKGSRDIDRKPRKRGTDFKRNIGKDKVTQRISNLNEVLVKLAYKNNVAYGLSFYHILIAKNRPKLIGREMQNIRLCKGVNKPLVLIASFARKPDQMRWPHDLVSLGVVLGLPENYAKLGHSDFIWQKLDLKQQIKRGELVVPGVKLVT